MRERFPYQLMDILVRTMESRDVYTVDHQHMVSKLARRLAQELQLSSFEVEGIRIAAHLHDIGKIAVPAELLTKFGKLQSEEFTLIKTHVKRGVEILKDVDFPWPVKTMVAQHHERLDGSGYPEGLRGDEITLGSRILAVADVANAVTRTRPYRQAMGVDAMLAIFRDDQGVCFDTDVVSALNQLVQQEDKIMMECL